MEPRHFQICRGSFYCLDPGPGGRGPTGVSGLVFFEVRPQPSAGAALYVLGKRVAKPSLGSEQVGFPMAASRNSRILVPRGLFAARFSPAAVIGIGGRLFVSCGGAHGATVGVTP